MAGRVLRKTRSLLKATRRPTIRNNAITYGICLLVAAMLWLLHALEKEYVTEVTYPARYSDLPRGKVLASDVPAEITLEIKARGLALLRHELGTSFLPVVFNVNSDLLEGDDVMEKRVDLNNIKERLAARFYPGIQLLRVKPESILFRFERVGRKKVPVIHDTRYTTRSQYILQGEITVEPDSVVLEGPAARVDTIRAARLAPLILTDLHKNVSRTVALLDIPGVRPLADEARVTVKVERYTEGKKTLPVVARGLPATLNPRLFPASVEVTYHVGLSRYDQVHDSHFLLTVDFSQATPSAGSLEVKLEKAPAFVRNVTLSPERVEFLVEGK
ncbi:MAG: YbbR-like domain-containing protein [Odoribacteraceae bacterium]|jgi:hypothetical protein|nr:YbbR-like domain-containing protein [Odoribacteraceae bacterium]